MKYPLVKKEAKPVSYIYGFSKMQTISFENVITFHSVSTVIHSLSGLLFILVYAGFKT